MQVVQRDEDVTEHLRGEALVVEVLEVLSDARDRPVLELRHDTKHWSAAATSVELGVLAVEVLD